MDQLNKDDRDDVIENFAAQGNALEVSRLKSRESGQNVRTRHTQNAPKSTEQLSSKNIDTESYQPIDETQKNETATEQANPNHTLKVEARPTSKPQHDNRPHKIGRRKTKARKKTGGWPTTSGISHQDFKHLIRSVEYLDYRGFQFRHFISIRPPAEITGHAARKKYCRDVSDSIRRRFNRNGHEFIGIAVFELEPGGLIHLHLTIHTTSKSAKLLKYNKDTEIFHVRPYDSKGLGYLLKSRLPTHPDRERELIRKFPRRRNEKIRGKRWFWTKDAKAILPNEGRTPTRDTALNEIRVRMTLPSPTSLG